MSNNSQNSQIICPLCKKQYKSPPYLNICCHSTACFYCLTKQADIQPINLKTPSSSLPRRNKTPDPSSSEIQNYSIHSRTLGSSMLQPFPHSFLSKQAEPNLEANQSPREIISSGSNDYLKIHQNFTQQYCPFCHRTGQKVKLIENRILRCVLEQRGINLTPIPRSLLQKHEHRRLQPSFNEEIEVSASQTNPLESSFQNHREFVNESLSVTRIQQIMLCQRCGESKSQWKCKDCGNILLCGVCSKVLHSLGVYAKHNLQQFIPQPTTNQQLSNAVRGNQTSSPSKLLKASSAKIKCYKHSDRYASYFDMQNWEPLCNECMREARTQNQESEQQHVVSIEVALCRTLHDIRYKQKHITGKIIQRNDFQKGVNNIMENNEVKYEEMNRKIRKGFDELKNALEIKQNEMLHDLHDCKIMCKGVLKEKFTQNAWSLDKLNLLNQVVMKGLNDPQFLFLYGVQYIMREIESFTTRQKINVNAPAPDDPMMAMIQPSLYNIENHDDKTTLQEQQAMKLPQIEYPILPNFQQINKFISSLNIAMPKKKQEQDVTRKRSESDISSPFFRDMKQKELMNVVGGTDISPACTYYQSQHDEEIGACNSARPSTYNTDRSSIESEQRQDNMYRGHSKPSVFHREKKAQNDHYGGMGNKSRKTKDYKNSLIPRVATLASSSSKRNAQSTENLHQTNSARYSHSSLSSSKKNLYIHERHGSQQLQPPVNTFQKKRNSLSSLNTPTARTLKRPSNIINKFNSSDSPKNVTNSSPLRKEQQQLKEIPQTSRFSTGKNVIELRRVESESNLMRPSSCTNNNSGRFVFNGSSGGNKLRHHLRKNFIKSQNRESNMINGTISSISTTPRDHLRQKEIKKKISSSRYQAWGNPRNSNQMLQDCSADDQLSPKHETLYQKNENRYNQERMTQHQDVGGYSEMIDIDEHLRMDNKNNQIYNNPANFYLEQSYSSLLSNNDRIIKQQQQEQEQQPQIFEEDQQRTQGGKKKPIHKFRYTTPTPGHQKLQTTSTMAQSDRDHSVASSIQPLSITPPPISQQQQQQEELKKQIDPLSRRQFNIVAKTSTSIQVGWTHFKNIELPQGVQLLYHLDYVVVSKSGKPEPFRKIYKGRSFKCIITDLMPRTDYRFRVAPILVESDGNEIQGPWSDPVMTVKTYDLQRVKQSTLHPHASVKSNKGGQLINFTRPGIIHTQNPYTFGRQYWAINIQPSISFAYKSCDELTGSMIVGVIAKNDSHSKMIGTTINYSSLKGDMQIKLFLNAENNCLTIFTQESENGEKFINLPGGYQFYPALQNKSVVKQPQASLTTQFIYDLKPE